MKNKKKKYTCERCGCKTDYTLNMCEECFADEAEEHHLKNRKDLEWKWKVYNKIKKN